MRRLVGRSEFACLERMEHQRGGRAPIAVIGMALRVPGASTPERLWEHILARRDTLTRPGEDALRLLEADAVLGDVGRIIGRVPCEFYQGI
jgi:acyl transferase domain-containing protein